MLNACKHIFVCFNLVFNACLLFGKGLILQLLCFPSYIEYTHAHARAHTHIYIAKIIMLDCLYTQREDTHTDIYIYIYLDFFFCNCKNHYVRLFIHAERGREGGREGRYICRQMSLEVGGMCVCRGREG